MGEVAGAGRVVEKQHLAERGGYQYKREKRDPEEHCEQGARIIERR